MNYATMAGALYLLKLNQVGLKKISKSRCQFAQRKFLKSTQCMKSDLMQVLILKNGNN